MIYNANIIVPTLCPLQFKDIQNASELTHYPQAFQYVQKFGISKTIHVQFHFTSDPTAGAVTINVFNYHTDAPICIGGTAKTYTASVTTLSAGHYYMDYYIPCSELSGVVYFTVTSSQGLMLTSWPVEIGNTGDMIEITYFNTDNDFQTVFGNPAPVFQESNLFSVYVEGGFRPDGYTPSGNAESFSNQFAEPSLTYGMPFDVERLTLGDSNGLPRWMGQKLNAIFHCDTVLIDGFQWSRNSPLTVEYTGKLTGVYSIDLVPSTNRLTQTIAGDILITNEESTVITTEAEIALALSKTTDPWP